MNLAALAAVSDDLTNRPNSLPNLGPVPTLLPTLLLLFALLLASCTSGKRRGASPPPPPGDIVEIHLLAMPLALDLDKFPGADSLALKIYAVSRSHPKTQPLRSGRLEIRMFDGLLQGPPPHTNQLIRTWAFTPDELPAFLFQSPVGTGYALTPRWENQRPKQDKVTVDACYLPSEGPPVCSGPSVITVVSQ